MDCGFHETEGLCTIQQNIIGEIKLHPDGKWKEVSWIHGKQELPIWKENQKKVALL